MRQWASEPKNIIVQIRIARGYSPRYLLIAARSSKHWLNIAAIVRIMRPKRFFHREVWKTPVRQAHLNIHPCCFCLVAPIKRHKKGSTKLRLAENYNALRLFYWFFSVRQIVPPSFRSAGFSTFLCRFNCFPFFGNCRFVLTSVNTGVTISS